MKWDTRIRIISVTYSRRRRDVRNQTYPNKGYDIEKAIVLSVVFIIVLNAAIFVDKKLLKRSLSHGKNRTDRSE